MVYYYLDHPSDVYIHVISQTLEGLFEEAAKATFEVMLDTDSVRESEVLEVEVLAKDLEQLLYMWIDHLLLIFDSRSFAVAKARVDAIKKIEGETPFLLKAKVYGEEYDPKRHGQKVGVKAMTYSLMKISQVGEKWEAYFVLDI
ncbi:MAG: archease [Candidatus Methanomethylicia archaeon]|nr:archease [Candidatus Methanomethylicia archaeon]MCQ5374038.1 archease [Candidatus Methanomethylicia archaeon]